MQSIRYIAPAVLLAAAYLIMIPPHAIAVEEIVASSMTKQVIAAHCVKCHGPKKQEGEFRVDDLSLEKGPRYFTLVDGAEAIEQRFDAAGK